MQLTEPETPHLHDYQTRQEHEDGCVEQNVNCYDVVKTTTRPSLEAKTQEKNNNTTHEKRERKRKRSRIPARGPQTILLHCIRCAIFGVNYTYVPW